MSSNVRSKWFAWLQLIRLPNVFTAVADVAMGYLVTHRSLEAPWHFLSLVTASCLFYLSGMVLNDVFDADVDAREQPSRPIPSGRVSVQSAFRVGWLMWSLGLCIAWLVSFANSNLRPGAVATLLGVCVVLYDRALKSTPIAPIIMGACRSLNVLLGMSLASSFHEPIIRDQLLLRPWMLNEWLIAGGIGLYVVGITIFAGSDAQTSSRVRLLGGLVVILSSMTMLALIPSITANQPPIVVVHNGWLMLWGLLGLITGRRCIVAIIDPTSQSVQSAVRHCVHSIIVLDAAICVGYAGPIWGLVVISLIFPTIALTAWLRAT